MDQGQEVQNTNLPGTPVKACVFGRFMFIITIITLIFPLTIWYVVRRNSYIIMRTKIDEAFSGIDVQLKARRDTLTKLVDAVKGSMEFEKTTLQQIVMLREENYNGGSVTDKAAALSRMDKLTKDINVLLENYPNLKSTDAVLEFQRATREIENNIAASRRIYNSNVSVYNQKIPTWPGIIPAADAKLSKQLFFEATQEDRTDVKVDF